MADKKTLLIKVKAAPSSKKEEFVEISGNSFKIKVREPAERNLANERIIDLLRERFGSKADIRIIKGSRSSSKIISVSTVA